MIGEGKNAILAFFAVSARFLLLGILALKNCLHEESEKKNMKVRHHNQSEKNGNEAPKFDAFIGRNTAQKIGGDFLVLSNHNAADNNDNEADKNPSKTKIPIHMQ